MKPDITSKKDIELLVNSFYDKVKPDPLIGFFFKDIVPVNWPEHLPRMYDFWSSIVFGDGTFKGNPIAKHLKLNQMHRLTPAHFNHWLALWAANADALFAGPNTETIKQRAQTIAGIMQYKIRQLGMN